MSTARARGPRHGIGIGAHDGDPPGWAALRSSGAEPRSGPRPLLAHLVTMAIGSWHSKPWTTRHAACVCVGYEGRPSSLASPKTSGGGPPAPDPALRGQGRQTLRGWVPRADSGRGPRRRNPTWKALRVPAPDALIATVWSQPPLDLATGRPSGGPRQADRHQLARRRRGCSTSPTTRSLSHRPALPSAAGRVAMADTGPGTSPRPKQEGAVDAADELQETSQAALARVRVDEGSHTSRVKSYDQQPRRGGTRRHAAAAGRGWWWITADIADAANGRRVARALGHNDRAATSPPAPSTHTRRRIEAPRRGPVRLTDAMTGRLPLSRGGFCRESHRWWRAPAPQRMRQVPAACGRFPRSSGRDGSTPHEVR